MAGRVERGAWADLDEAALLALLERDGLTGAHGYDDAPDARYEAHTHDYDKVLHCVRGGVVFTTADGDLALRPGDRLSLDRGTAHSAVVGPAGVRCVEARRDT